jgi:hypothetical protein
MAQVFVNRNPLLLVATMAAFVFSILEIRRLDLGHELTWFGNLSQMQALHLRYAALLVTVFPFAAAALP